MESQKEEYLFEEDLLAVIIEQYIGIRDVRVRGWVRGSTRGSMVGWDYYAMQSGVWLTDVLWVGHRAA